MKDGKFLEMLVECLQKTLATDEIMVSPDEKFYNSKGTQIGQVDIVLKGKMGSASIKIGIECRDRAGRQDRNWIREIIGKKQDLARFKFSHWIAVSKYGFTSTAIELAEENNIELLIPGELRPSDEKLFGIHSWMSFFIECAGFKPTKTIGGQLDTSEDCSKSQENRIKKDVERLSPNILVSENGIDFLGLCEFIDFKAGNYLKDNFSNRHGQSFNEKRKLNFTNLKASLDSLKFDIDTLTIEFDFFQELIRPQFKMMAFITPNTTDILGVIGVNEYQSKEYGTLYLMVGYKPNGKNEPIMLGCNSKGDKIKNLYIVSKVYPPHIPTKTIKFKINP